VKKMRLKKTLLSLTILASLILVIGAIQANNAAAADFTIPNPGLPSGNADNPAGTLMKTILNWIVWVGGILCVVIILWAGISYATAGGDEDKTTKAKDRLIYGIIGIAVIVGAYIIANAISSIIGSSTPNQPTLP